MKKTLLFVFTCFLLVGTSAYAASSMLGGTPAHQSFQEADPVASSHNDSQQAAKVAAIMKQAHQLVQSKAAKQSVPPTSMTATPVKLAHPVVAVKASNENQVAVNQALPQNHYQQLAQQLARLNQTNLQFQQAENQKIAVVSNQIEKLQARQGQLMQLMQLFNQQVVALNRGGAIKPIHLNGVDLGSQAHWLERFQTQYSMYVIIALLATILLMLLFRKRIDAPVEEAVIMSEPDTKDEYDFMGSSEAIPAKLDLAHAYVAMEDFVAARKALKQVLDSGDAEQQKEARTMLDSISGK